MKAKTNCYCQQNKNIQIVIISTRTIVHPCLDVSARKNVADIPRSIHNKNKAQKVIQWQPIFIDDKYHDYILDERVRSDNIDYERNIKNHEILSLLKYVMFNIFTFQMYVLPYVILPLFIIDH